MKELRAARNADFPFENNQGRISKEEEHKEEARKKKGQGKKNGKAEGEEGQEARCSNIRVFQHVNDWKHEMLSRTPK